MPIGFCGNQTHPIDEILVYDYGMVVVPFDEGLTEGLVRGKLKKKKRKKLKMLRSEPVEIA